MKLGHDVPLMDKWFARDDNAEPSVFYLRNMTDILKYYDDDSPENAKSRNKVNASVLSESCKVELTRFASSSFRLHIFLPSHI